MPDERKRDFAWLQPAERSGDFEDSPASIVDRPDALSVTTDPDGATAAINTFGRLDILSNIAGVGTPVRALRETSDQFRAVVDVTS
jgi:NAD(P)-dependent dehydrogenase (short-subunit alcohol dehydrogenase family)